MQLLEEYPRVTIVSLVFPSSLGLNKDDDETPQQQEWDLRGFGRASSVLLLLVLLPVDRHGILGLPLTDQLFLQLLEC
jgi:hypothetical protein